MLWWKKSTLIAQPLPNSRRWTTTQDLRIINEQGSENVFIVDIVRVVKAAGDSRKTQLENERNVYRAILAAEAVIKKPCLHILRCFNPDDPRGIILERCCEKNVRSEIQWRPELQSVFEARKLAKQAAEGLKFLHGHNIVHGNFGCHNMLLTSKTWLLRICDFSSSYVGSRRLSDSAPTKKKDIFDLGSSIYEISTRKLPYGEESQEKVETQFKKHGFPPGEDNTLRPVITKCWSQAYPDLASIVGEIDPQGSFKYQVQDLIYAQKPVGISLVVLHLYDRMH